LVLPVPMNNFMQHKLAIVIVEEHWKRRGSHDEVMSS
jgi:hypothetical protein